MLRPKTKRIPRGKRPWCRRIFRRPPPTPLKPSSPRPILDINPSSLIEYFVRRLPSSGEVLRAYWLVCTTGMAGSWFVEQLSVFRKLLSRWSCSITMNELGGNTSVISSASTRFDLEQNCKRRGKERNKGGVAFGNTKTQLQIGERHEKQNNKSRPLYVCMWG